MWPATNEGDWPLAVFWPDVLYKRTWPNTKGRMAEDEGRGAEDKESCHSDTIPLMPVFFFKFSLRALLKVTRFLLNLIRFPSEDCRYSVLASVVKTLFTGY